MLDEFHQVIAHSVCAVVLELTMKMIKNVSYSKTDLTFPNCEKDN